MLLRRSSEDVGREITHGTKTAYHGMSHNEAVQQVSYRVAIHVNYRYITSIHSSKTAIRNVPKGGIAVYSLNTDILSLVKRTCQRWSRALCAEYNGNLGGRVELQSL